MIMPNEKTNNRIKDGEEEKCCEWSLLDLLHVVM